MDSNELIVYAPEGAPDPEKWIQMVQTHVMGVDGNGNPRPIEDFLLFLHYAKRTQLDPLARQIYAIYRFDKSLGRQKMAIQVAIDGARLIAQRTGEYGGQDDATFEPRDESEKYPRKATVTVYRVNKITGERMPTTKSARWNEYAPYDKSGNLTGLWYKMPYGQLAKCAEMLALRAAFPAELSGIYAAEEMDQADNNHPALSSVEHGPLLEGKARAATNDAYTDRLVEDGKGAMSQGAVEIEKALDRGLLDENTRQGGGGIVEDGVIVKHAAEPEPKCPNCGGPMWDNRQKKADGQLSPKAPDYKCMNKECVSTNDETDHKSLYWPGQWPPPKAKPSKEQLNALLTLAGERWPTKERMQGFPTWFTQQFPNNDTSQVARTLRGFFGTLDAEQVAQATAQIEADLSAFARLALAEQEKAAEAAEKAAAEHLNPNT